jgi:hypothetical protein
MDILHEDQYNIIIISHSALLRMENISENVVEKIEKHILFLTTFFSKKVLFMK